MASQAIRSAQSGFEQPMLGLAPEFDRVILLLYLVLISLGLVMVSSASIGIADQQTGNPFYFAKRQFLRILLSLAILWFTCRIPLEFWKRNGMMLMLGSIVLLGCVLIPGVGHTGD